MSLTKIQIKEYSSKEWKLCRERILQRDKYTCRHCGISKSNNNNIILQVHHKKYIKNKHPWEYSDDILITLCKGCHAKEHGLLNLPNDGWELEGYSDLGEKSGICEYCGSPYRYEYMISHSNWGYMMVGECCAKKLTNQENDINIISNEIKKEASRIENFINSSKWIQKNNIYYRTYSLKCDKYKIKISKNKDDFNLQITYYLQDTYLGYPNKSISKEGKTYKSLIDAKTKAYKVINNGSFKKYVYEHYKLEQGILDKIK